MADQIIFETSEEGYCLTTRPTNHATISTYLVRKSTRLLGMFSCHTKNVTKSLRDSLFFAIQLQKNTLFKIRYIDKKLICRKANLLLPRPNLAPKINSPLFK